MGNSTLTDLWSTAARFDPQLRFKPELLPRLRRKQVHPRPYGREALFEAMACGRPVVLSGVHVPVHRADELGTRDALVQLLSHGMPRSTRARAQIGPQHVRRHLTVPELMRRWASGRHIVSVTDLHIRDTRLEERIDTRELSAFNLLPLGSPHMQRQEMMTLVVSSAGNVTDSHSDDPDGSNHCFTGCKLWLAWETFEGQRAGLQDCERQPVNGRARFDLRAFCSLRSARWWTVGPGETLFLPGKLTHRVITIEPYIGIGSFYVAPASCLDSLSRWFLHGPLWANDAAAGGNPGLVEEMARAAHAQLHRLQRRAGSTRLRWGLDYVPMSLQHWQRNWTSAQRRALMGRPEFAALLQAATGTA